MILFEFPQSDAKPRKTASDSILKPTGERSTRKIENARSSLYQGPIFTEYKRTCRVFLAVGVNRGPGGKMQTGDQG